MIAGNRSALPEVCGDAAELIDPGAREELASALLELATDEPRREELIARGLRTCRRISLGRRASSKHSGRLSGIAVETFSCFFVDRDAESFQKSLVLRRETDSAGRGNFLRLVGAFVFGPDSRRRLRAC